MGDLYEEVPTRWGDSTEHRFKLAAAINAVLAGARNRVFQITLDANADSTEVLVVEAHTGAVALFVPLSQTASAETPWIELSRGKVVFHHGNSADTTRRFGLVVFG